MRSHKHEYRFGIFAFLVGGVTALVMWTAAPALANPTVSVSGVAMTAKVSGTSETFDSNPVVCAATDAINVTATLSATYDTNTTLTNQNGGCATCAAYNTLTGKTCSAVNSGINSVQYITSVATTYDEESCRGSATDGNSGGMISLTCPGSPASASFGPFVLQTGSDGAYTVTVRGNAMERQTTTRTLTSAVFWSNTSCGGSNKGNTTENTQISSTSTILDAIQVSSSVDYVLDITPPSMIHSVISGTITQNGTQAHDLTVTGGSSGEPYTLSAQAVGPGPTTLGPVTSTGAFGTNTPTDNGIAPDLVQTSVLDLNTSCSTQVGTYEDTASVTSSDLCGGNWSTTTPPATKTIDSSSNPVPFAIEPDASCGFKADAYVFAPLTGNNYETVQCFNSMISTAKGNFGKPLSDPGTVHPAAVITTPSEGNSQTNIVITITLPDDFGLLMTGNGKNQSAYTHVCIGAAIGFFPNNNDTCAPLTGYQVDPSEIMAGGQDSNGYYHTLTVNLSGVNVGFGAGTIPDGDIVYVKTHAVFIGPNADQNESNTEEPFMVKATSDQNTVGITGTYGLYENPTCSGMDALGFICSDGIVQYTCSG